MESVPLYQVPTVWLRARLPNSQLVILGKFLSSPSLLPLPLSPPSLLSRPFPFPLLYPFLSLLRFIVIIITTTIFLRQWLGPRQLGRLTGQQKPLGLACPHQPTSGIVSACHHTPHFLVSSGAWTQVLSLTREVFTDGTSSSVLGQVSYCLCEGTILAPL